MAPKRLKKVGAELSLALLTTVSVRIGELESVVAGLLSPVIVCCSIIPGCLGHIFPTVGITVEHPDSSTTKLRRCSRCPLKLSCIISQGCLFFFFFFKYSIMLVTFCQIT